MKTLTYPLLFLCLFLSLQACAQEPTKEKRTETAQDMKKTDAYWKDKLNPEAFRILRQKGTEYPHTGEYNLDFEEGTYSCYACKEPLFASSSKFKSDCGWPSFD